MYINVPIDTCTCFFILPNLNSLDVFDIPPNYHSLHPITFYIQKLVQGSILGVIDRDVKRTVISLSRLGFIIPLFPESMKSLLERGVQVVKCAWEDKPKQGGKTV
jgi:hypothetical protein